MKSYRDCSEARTFLRIEIDCCDTCHHEFTLQRFPTEPTCTTKNGEIYLTCCAVAKLIEPNVKTSPLYTRTDHAELRALSDSQSKRA